MCIRDSCSGAWGSGPEDLSPPEYFWGYNRMLTVDGLFGAGDTVGGSAHKFSSGSFTEGRLAAKAAVKYILDMGDDEINVITVATPNSRHLEIVTSAVRAGKHVFCEKPVGRTPIETQHMADLSSRAGIISGVGYNYRWSPMVQHAHQLIKEGKLGKVTHYRGRVFCCYASNPN
mgnify:CR=1 FL=1